MNPISRNELKELLDSGGSEALLDVNLEEYFRAAHLPGAKNACVFNVDFLEKAGDAARDKAATIVVYGSSHHSLASSTAAAKLDRAGYLDVRDYRGGLEDWEGAGLPVERGPAPPPPPEPKLGRHNVDTEKSIIHWTGRNMNSAHTGTVRLNSGWIDVISKSAASGEMILDMDSLANTDINDSALNRVLISHLKSDDFFDTIRFPIATFHLRHVTFNPHAKPGNINADISGSLTLKGVTEDLGFPALIEVLPDGAPTAEAHFDIDRTRWNVIYGSGKFYEKLGQHLVHDNISLSLHIITH